MTQETITQESGEPFAPLTIKELMEILGLTIKHDEENKLATFLCALTAYTEDAQFNISFNAPSSTGKSFIPMEIARLFPPEDVMEIAYSSPTAFFHETGVYNEKTKTYLVDLSKKILIFLDQPRPDLLARLRPLLSHDKKETLHKITDKSERHGLRTKSVLLRGYPSVIFCTAGLRIDEQESTRFLLLSPDVSQEKIREGITATIRKEADSDGFHLWLGENPGRAQLKERIRAIKKVGITDINIGPFERVQKQFLAKERALKPKDQRDIKRLLSLIKAFALLNVFFRERNGTVLTANEEDVDAAFALWDRIATTQDLNIPPFVYHLYTDVILAAFKEKNVGREKKTGVTRQEVLGKHYLVYGRSLDAIMFRQQILPVLETAGLIVEEQDPSDKRRSLIFPSLLPEK